MNDDLSRVAKGDPGKNQSRTFRKPIDPPTADGKDVRSVATS